MERITGLEPVGPLLGRQVLLPIELYPHMVLTMGLEPIEKQGLSLPRLPIAPRQHMVQMAGLEPARPFETLAPQASPYTSSSTSAYGTPGRG